MLKNYFSIDHYFPLNQDWSIHINQHVSKNEKYDQSIDVENIDQIRHKGEDEESHP